MSTRQQEVRNLNTKKLKPGILALFLLIAVGDVLTTSDVGPTIMGDTIDDWQYNGDQVSLTEYDYVFHIPGHAVFSFVAGVPFISPGVGLFPTSILIVPYLLFQQSIMDAQESMYAQAQRSGTGDLGYATGGAKDIKNFRDNIDNGYLPSPTDITHQGLYFQYYLDRGQSQECEQLFCPSYSQAVSADPLTGEREEFMTVGLNSNMAADEFERKNLNIVLVLDISGSMGRGFNSYYYDRFGNKQEVNNTGTSKMTVAAESLATLTDHLRDGDRLGVVLFNSGSYKAKPIRLTENTDMDAIKSHMLELRAGGGTNMDTGMQMATDMMQGYADSGQEAYENRIVFLTDAMPNIGRTSESGLLGMTESNAEQNIHTTFVGIGVDFNTELVQSITSIKGANYFSVHSSDQFRERMDENFKYMVTPLVFNLNLTLESPGYTIDKVYGSTAADESTGRVMRVNTLFPSPTRDDETRGGVVLLRLNHTGISRDLDLTVAYEDRTGQQHESSRSISFGDHDPEYFDHDGIRKAILLTRYVDLMKNWVIYEQGQYAEPVSEEAYEQSMEPGIEPAVEDGLNQWEQQSTPLTVSNTYEPKISSFKAHYESEMGVLGDDSLSQEADLMESLLAQ